MLQKFNVYILCINYIMILLLLYPFNRGLGKYLRLAKYKG